MGSGADTTGSVAAEPCNVDTAYYILGMHAQLVDVYTTVSIYYESH